MQQDKYDFDHVHTGFWEHSTEEYRSQVVWAEHLVGIIENIRNYEDPS